MGGVSLQGRGGAGVPGTPLQPGAGCLPQEDEGLTYLGSFVANLSSQTPGTLRARVSL